MFAQTNYCYGRASRQSECKNGGDRNANIKTSCEKSFKAVEVQQRDEAGEIRRRFGAVTSVRQRRQEEGPVRLRCGD
jgi:hypothetical protein